MIYTDGNSLKKDCVRCKMEARVGRAWFQNFYLNRLGRQMRELYLRGDRGRANHAETKTRMPGEWLLSFLARREFGLQQPLPCSPYPALQFRPDGCSL